VDIKSFESAPHFNAAERKKYFYPSDWVKSVISEYDTDTNKIGFVLLFGYFQATKGRTAKTGKMFHRQPIISG